MGDQPNYVFICSAGHSGSTLLDMILGSNSCAVSLGEITHLPKNLALDTECTCGASVRSCGFWSKVVEQMSCALKESVFENPYCLDLGYIDSHVIVDRSHQTKRYRLKQKVLLGIYYLSLRFGMPPPPVVGRHFRKIVNNNRLLFETVRRVAGKRCVIDSSKSYLKALAYYKAHPENTRIISLSRDGRGVFYSGLHRGVGLRNALDAWRLHYARSRSLYRGYVSREHILNIRYESLATDPESELKRLCEFLRIPYEIEMLKFLDKEHHITNGNNMRFSSSVIRLDEKWRNGLTPGQLDYFRRHAGKLNASLGYE